MCQSALCVALNRLGAVWGALLVVGTPRRVDPVSAYRPEASVQHDRAPQAPEDAVELRRWPCHPIDVHIDVRAPRRRDLRRRRERSNLGIDGCAPNSSLFTGQASVKPLLRDDLTLLDQVRQFGSDVPALGNVGPRGGFRFAIERPLTLDEG